MSQDNTLPADLEEASPDSARTPTEEALERLRLGDHQPPTELLKGLPSQRWRVVDRFESDGKRYVLACRDDEPTTGLARLTAREREVVSYASRGFTNKAIGYEMELSASTVGVLLFRASKKLGTTNRRELVAAYACQPTGT